MTLGEYRLYSPYFSLFEGAGASRFKALSQQFSSLPEEAKDLLTSESVAGQLQTLCEEGTIRPKFRVATGKVIGLVALGDVPPQAVFDLLKKIGVSEDDATRAASVLSETLETLDTLRATPPITEPPEAASLNMPQLPPLTQRIPSAPPPHSSNTPPRNIIDLRSKK